MLVVNDVSKAFGALLAVNRVSFELQQGEILGLIGPNGSGKSTLFNVISGTLKPSEGSIRFEDQDITGLAPDKICHLGLARTFQIPRPFRKLTLLENVSLSAYYGSNASLSQQAAQDQARQILGLVGLPTDPEAGVDVLGAAGLKKLELARALATQPKLLLADESLGGLDTSEMDQAADLLECIRRDMGITIIWVEHIMGVLMRVVDRVIVLDYGEKIAEGLPSEVVKDPKVIEVYLGNQSSSG